MNRKHLILLVALSAAVCLCVFCFARAGRSRTYTLEELETVQNSFNAALNRNAALLREHDIYMSQAFIGQNANHVTVAVQNLTPALERLLRERIYDHPALRFISTDTGGTQPA